MLRGVVLLLALGSPLSAQVVGAGFQIARSNQVDTKQAQGLSVRLRFGRRVELRYDHLLANGQRFDSPCGGFIPPGCGPETIDYTSRLHGFFVAVRVPMLSRGLVQLALLPEAGIVRGTIVKRSAATGQVGSSGTGGAPGAGLGLELSAARVGGTPFGVWIAGRFRGFVHPGSYALDGYEPHRGLDWIRSVEIGATLSMR